METTFYNIEEQKFWNDESIWVNGGHEWSGSFGTTENLWNKYIFDDLKSFRGANITEIAPGFGRITQFLAIVAGRLSVVDMNPICIQKTKEKLGAHVASYGVGDGKTLVGVQDLSQDLVFSFDSFVHMHKNVINEYVKEMQRVLVPGGYGWIHHSNLMGGSELSFNNVAGRSNMTPEEMKDMVEAQGFKVISQKPIQFAPVDQWNGIDFITFFQKL